MTTLPRTLIYEILLRCPVETVENFVAAYPASAAAVGGNSFYREFLRKSPYIQRDRALLATRVESIFPEPRKWNFMSTSIVEQEDILLLCTTTTVPLDNHRNKKFINYSCGLLCSGFGEDHIVFNPTNGRYRILPGAFCGENEDVRTFIGFSSTSRFKVIAIKKNACKILVLDTMVWKPIQCNLLYEPATASVCIEGIIYYAAYETPRRMVLVSFDMETELFQIITIPQPPKYGQIFFEKIMNVNGKVGICFAADDHMVRILDNPAEQLWSERLIKHPDSIVTDMYSFSLLSFEGFTYNGELVFSQELGSKKVIYYYDEVNNSFRKHIYEVQNRESLIFLEHVDCTMFLGDEQIIVPCDFLIASA